MVSGGYTGGATPVPIPNTEVKPSRVDGTAGETLWESRTPPEFISRNAQLIMSWAFRFCAPDMHHGPRVQVPREAGRSDPSEPQGDQPRGGAGGSGNRSRGPMDKNRIRGDAERGERANDREAPATKARRRRSGGRAVKAVALTR